jgi:sarcosine oxidase subunit beta
MTPDGLPIIGADPDWDGLLYAAGHSRNGILMAPLTGDVIAALAGGQEPSVDLRPFDVRRFGRATSPHDA